MNFKNILPYLSGIIIFYLLTVFFFKVEIIDGKRLSQVDIVQFAGMSKGTIDYYEKTGEQALWNDAMFSGLPDYLISTGISDGPIAFFWRATQGFLPKSTGSQLVFTAMLCGWIMLLCFRVNPYLAILGGIALAFNSYNIINIDAGHITKSLAISYGALVLGGMRLVFDKKYYI